MSKDTPQSKESFNIISAEFDGYLVTKPGYRHELITRIYFAGELDDCLDFIREQYEPMPVLTEDKMKETMFNFEEGPSGSAFLGDAIKRSHEQIEKALARHTEAAIKALFGSIPNDATVHVGSDNGEFPFDFTIPQLKSASERLREAWAKYLSEHVSK